MDAIKGLARRATQTFREKVTSAETTNDEKLNDVCKKVRLMEKNAVTLSDKVLRVAKLIEELGALMKDIGEEFKSVPDLSPETQQIADDTLTFGTTLVQKATEHQQPLKEHAFDALGAFVRDIVKLRDAEDDRKKKQLEYDFFRQKVLELRKSPPKDFTRIPRNEQILENWRVELWKSTENTKTVASTLYSQGQRALDQSVLTVGQVLNSFLNIAASGAKHTYGNARLPLYSSAPVLTPAPLPPNPLPPFQYPNSAAPPPAQVSYAPTAQDYHSPQNTHGQWNGQPQQQPSGAWAQPPPQQQWGQASQQQPQAPQQQTAWGQPASPNPTWGQAPVAQQQQQPQTWAQQGQPAPVQNQQPAWTTQQQPAPAPAPSQTAPTAPSAWASAPQPETRQPDQPTCS